ncbi:MAG: hypothetical protein IRY97_12745 [Thermomicrobiaceae bacterium]|nr:hypothetical protein [Thermomicrobiaceae bacterium]
MPDQEIIDQLIATYRELNHRIRVANPDELYEKTKANSGGESLAGILYQMRNRELNASQAIKQMLLGQDAPLDDEAEPEALTGQEAATGPALLVLLSQFGTAREATLTMVRTAPDEVWNAVHVTPRGRMTLRDYLKTLVDRDKQSLQRVDELLAKAGV